MATIINRKHSDDVDAVLYKDGERFIVHIVRYLTPMYDEGNTFSKCVDFTSKNAQQRALDYIEQELEWKQSDSI